MYQANVQAVLFAFADYQFDVRCNAFSHTI